MSKLAVVGEFGRAVFDLIEGSNLIGRPDPDSRSIPQVNLETLDKEAKVSRGHAVVEQQGEQLLLEDLNSLNGTYLYNPIDGSQTKMESGRKYPLRIGDRFTIGRLIIQVID